jgi:hypothetical protein
MRSFTYNPQRLYYGPPPVDQMPVRRGLEYSLVLQSGPATFGPGSVFNNYWGDKLLGYRAGWIPVAGTGTAPLPYLTVGTTGYALRTVNDNSTSGQPAYFYTPLTGRPILTSQMSEMTIAMMVQLNTKPTAHLQVVCELLVGTTWLVNVEFDEAGMGLRFRVGAGTDSFSTDISRATSQPVPVVFSWRFGEGCTLYFGGSVSELSAGTAASTIASDTDTIALGGSRTGGLKQQNGTDSLISAFVVSNRAWTKGEAVRWCMEPFGHQQQDRVFLPAPADVSAGPYTVSETSIANAALRIIGERKISSLGDQTKAARLLADAYPETRDELIRAMPWKFAIHRAQLASDDEKPGWGYARQYSLPDDSLRFLSAETDRAWTLEGRKILSDALPPLEIVYLRKREDPQEFDPLFRATLSAALAVEVAEALTGERRSLALAYSALEKSWNLARDANAKSGPVTILEGESDFLRSRGLGFFRLEKRDPTVTWE